MTTFPLILIRAAGLPFEAIEPLRSDFSGLFRILEAVKEEETTLRSLMLQAMTDALTLLPESPLRTAIYNARREAHNHRDVAFHRSIRKMTTGQDHSPVTSMWKIISDWHQKKEEKEQVLHEIRQIHEATTRQTLLELQRLAANIEVLRRSLLFASHDLLDALPAFIQSPLTGFAQKERNIAFSLAEYLCRAALKTSPFSRLTTVALWRWTEDLSAEEDNKEDSDFFSGSKAIVTPNVALLPLIYEVLLREPAFFRSLTIRLNPTFHPGASAENDLNWLFFDGAHESFQQLQSHPVATLIIHTLLERGRKIPFTDLLSLLQASVEAGPDQLQTLVIELIDLGLLEWMLPEPGLSPGWCSNLYQYLGYLPSAPVLTDAAFLLHWLRTAARVIPHQPLGEAQETQREAAKQLNAFFQKYNVQSGTAETTFTGQQIFFEDVERSVEMAVPKAAVERIVAELKECWQQKALHALPPFRARLFAFAQKVLTEGESIDFLGFSQQFLQQQDEAKHTLMFVPRYQGKIGALLQIFQENGEYRAVVNALFPGGGQLFARWLHVLPADAREGMQQWNTSIPFPWQGWSNANFQPASAPIVLDVPDARLSSASGGSALPLSDLVVRIAASGLPQLLHKQTGQLIRCTDLGLESPETYPPVMQVLWHLTVPYVSKAALFPDPTDRVEQKWGWHYPAVEAGSLIVQRQRWEVLPEIWRDTWTGPASSDPDFFIRVRSALAAVGVPAQFFMQFSGRREKPQFIDCDSPLLMSLFEKRLRQGHGNLILTEMLPVASQSVTSHDGLACAAEFVIELEV